MNGHEEAPTVGAEGLTEAERDTLAGLALTVPDRDRLEAAVERIHADRLHAVQAERDRKDRMWRDALDRAVAAETGERAALAERDDLRAALDRVRALADEYDEDYQTPWRLIRDLRAAVEGGRS